jgi:LmbE family N-acetylglucosaminyl deacetylase
MTAAPPRPHNALVKQIEDVKTLLGVWAHPDDEAYLSAGLMRRVVRAGGRVVCVTATHGERGTDDPAEWPPDRLARLRARELQAALAAVGVTESRLLDHPDGGCADLPAASVRAAVASIAAAIEEVRPDAIVTFGPDGMTDHPDHIAVSRWTTAAWLAGGGSGELLYATTSRSFAAHHEAMHRRLGLFPPGFPVAIADDDVAFSVELDEDELVAKRAMLAAHASQTEPLARLMGEAAYLRWWTTESFRRPVPAELSEEASRLAS